MIFTFLFAVTCVTLASPVILFVLLDAAKSNREFWLGAFVCYFSVALFGLILGSIIECVLFCVLEEAQALRRRIKVQALAKKHN